MIRTRLRLPYGLAKVAADNISQLQSQSRSFSSSRPARIQAVDVESGNIDSIRANADRLWSDIHTTAQWGQKNRYGTEAEQTGLSRLSLGKDDKLVREWFIDTVRSLNCKVQVDAIGNIFAIRPGRRNDVPAIFCGSHLDSQPSGGRFDGILGVCAGLEVLRVLEDHAIETNGPIGVVNWTNEEGARFPLSMMGSGVWAESLDLDKVYDLPSVVPDDNSTTVLQELEKIGFRGAVPANWRDGVPMKAHFELHIEQGPYLVNSNQDIGIVQGVQAYKWFRVVTTGRACHTGTTGYQDRADALYWASNFITKVRQIAQNRGGLASVGVINAEPGSVNTVPEKVTMSLDVRHPKDETVETIVHDIADYLENLDTSIDGSPPVSFHVEETFNTSAVQFDPLALACVEASSQSILDNNRNAVRKMFSGAGHDSVNTSKRCPTAMIFIPCKDGLSHHPAEWASKHHSALGASVLAQSVLRFDQLGK